MGSDLHEVLEELRVLNDTVQRVRVDRSLHIRAHSDGRLREATVRDQRDRRIVEVLDNPSHGITQAELGRALGLSRQRIRQILVRTRRKLVSQEETA